MSLSLVTFSEYSDTSDDLISQPSNYISNSKELSNNKRCRPIPRFHLVSSVVRKINLESDEPSSTIKLTSKANSLSTSSSQSKQFSNNNSFIYKNGRKIIISKACVSPEKASPNTIKKIDLREINFDSNSDESESYYSYSQYYSEPVQNNQVQNHTIDDTNVNNLPKIITQNNQEDNTNQSLGSSEINQDANININIKDNIALFTNNETKQQFKQENIKKLDQYRVERGKKGFSIKGKSIKFTLNTYEGGEYFPSVEALVTGSKVSFIDCSTHEIIGSMKASKKYSHFLIRRGYLYGKIIMEIYYKSFNNVKPRSSTMNVYDQIIFQKKEALNTNTKQNIYSRYIIPTTQTENQEYANPNKLKSKPPKRGIFGMWSLDFGSRKIISSIKNSIIVDENNVEYMILGKVAENSLSVEVANGMDPICVFGVAISAFLNTKP